jgi:hypothetical protein
MTTLGHSCLAIDPILTILDHILVLFPDLMEPSHEIIKRNFSRIMIGLYEVSQRVWLSRIMITNYRS